MAKRRSGSTALVRPTVIVASPARRRSGGIRRAGRAVARHARRGGVALAKTAWEEKTAIAAVGGAGLLGYAEGSGMLSFIPEFGIGRIPELAIVTYGLGRVLKQPKLRQAGIGLAAAAAFGFGLTKGKENKK